MRKLVHSTSGDNNIAPFCLWWTETMLQHKKVPDILWGIVWKIFFTSYFFKYTWKLQKRSCVLEWNHYIFNNYYPAAICHLVTNLYLYIKYETVFLEKCQIQPFVTFLLLRISNLTAIKALRILKIAEIVIFKGSGASYEVKIMLRPISEIK